MESGAGGEESGERVQRPTFGTTGVGGGGGGRPVLPQRRLQELAAEVDPHQILDDDVEELLEHTAAFPKGTLLSTVSPVDIKLLMQLADDFIESAVSSSCQLARHRKSSTLETKDLQLHLERMWNMSIPGFGTEDQPHRKSTATEAHKQRVSLIKKSKR